VLQIRHPSGHINERRYIFDVVFTEFLGLEYELILDDTTPYTVIGLKDDNTQTKILVDDYLFSLRPELWLTTFSMPKIPLEQFRPSDLQIPYAKTVPILFKNHSQETTSKNQHRLPFDLFGGIFFMLTRYEESVNSKKLDEFGRFPASSSIAYRENFLIRPLADEYTEILWLILKKLFPAIQRRDCHYRVHLSHDVDIPFFGCEVPLKTLARGLGGDLLRRKNTKIFYNRLYSWLFQKPTCDPANTFDFILKTSEEIGIQSHFYFMATDLSSPKDATYSLRDKEIISLLKKIDERGHLIGIHPGFETFEDRELLLSEVKRLQDTCGELGIRQSVLGGRQHFLRWKNPETWQAWDEAELTYDSSVGYADHPGFRAGTCHEYPVFNLLTSQKLKLRERPLIVMEKTLLGSSYMDLDHEDSFQCVQNLSETCRHFKGNMTILWHNSHLVHEWERDLYEQIIQVIK
jgi:hypothetical protein